MKKFYMEDNMCTPYKLILNKANNYLLANGWQSVDSPDEADVQIVGGCAAFHSLEAEALGLIDKAKKTTAEVVVFGCLPTISPEKVKPFKPDQIIHARSWGRLATLVENPKVSFSEVPETNQFRMEEEYRLYDPGKAFILVCTGCSSNCPFCPHKIGIGNLKSRPLCEIIAQAKDVTDRGAHTIVLHGNDTGSYGVDIGTTFPAMVKNVLEVSPNLHLTQVNADWSYEYRDELFPLIKSNKKIKEFQTLIQSASDRVLTLMERRPVVKGLYPYFKDLRTAREDLILRTDIMIGYPTATEEEELETLEFVSQLFDEVAIHGFERFPHARIEKLSLPFYPQEEIDGRVAYAEKFLKSFPDLLVHRGGQVYKTLIDIEKPKDEMRKQRVMV